MAMPVFIVSLDYESIGGIEAQVTLKRSSTVLPNSHTM